MKVRTASTAVLVALSLSLTACGGEVETRDKFDRPVPVATCGPYEVRDGDGEDADECEADENQNGIGDDDEGFDAEDAGIGAGIGGAAAKAAKAAKKAAAKRKAARRSGTSTGSSGSGFKAPKIGGGFKSRK